MPHILQRFAPPALVFGLAACVSHPAGPVGTANSAALSGWKIGLYTDDTIGQFESEEKQLGPNVHLQLCLTYANYDKSNITHLGQWATARNTTLVVAFEPMPAVSTYTVMTPSQQRAYALDRIAAGDFDSKYVALADQLAGVGAEVWLRFASEMNLMADNTPWAIESRSGATLPGNGPANFIAAWRHVHHVVAVELEHQGVDPSRVKWVIAPGAHSWPDVPGNEIGEYYPGSSYVDILGMDGYNWGGSGWRSFAEVFDSGYQALSALDTSKPIMLAEFASDPAGGDRAAWIQHAADAMLQNYPRIIAFNWYDEGHWALSSSDGTYNAFATYFVGRGASSSMDAGEVTGIDGGGSPGTSGSCQTDMDCNGGDAGTEEVCGNANVCITGCHQDMDCPPPETCNRSGATWSCIEPPGSGLVDAGPQFCESDTDCTGGKMGLALICGDSGTCVSGCHTNSDCPNGQTCDMTLAVPACDTGVADAGTQLCKSDIDCTNGATGTETVCENGACVSGCRKDSDCEVGLSCDVSTTPGTCGIADGGTLDAGILDGGPSNIDGGPSDIDGGMLDAGDLDGGPSNIDGGTLDAGDLDGGPSNIDGGMLDAGDLDGGPSDIDGGPSNIDGGPSDIDGGMLDAGDLDGGMLDAGDLDGGPSDIDGGMLDAGDLDAGGLDSGMPQSCTTDADCNGGATQSGMVCSNSGATAGTCIPGCHSNADCPTGTTCDMSLPSWTCD